MCVQPNSNGLHRTCTLKITLSQVKNQHTNVQDEMSEKHELHWEREREKTRKNYGFFVWLVSETNSYQKSYAFGMVRYKSMKNIHLDLQSTCKCYGIFKLYAGADLACTNVQIKVEHLKTHLDGIYLMRSCHLAQFSIFSLKPICICWCTLMYKCG